MPHTGIELLQDTLSTQGIATDCRGDRLTSRVSTLRRPDVRIFCLAVCVAVVALIVAIRALQSGRRAARAGRRAGARRADSGSPAAPPPIPPHPGRTTRAPAPETASRHARGIAADSAGAEPQAGHAAANLAGAATASREAQPGFEERIGTRWVVWVGGLTLALGGFFMVRYSIEAGLLGPGVRTILGGLFALALLAAGEWTRRKESISAIAALPIANIPAILTAAGTAVAFATVYAAYALYGFLVPGHRLHPARPGRAGHAGRGAAARPGARRARRGRRLRHAGAGLVRQARLLGALHLSRDRHRRRLRTGARAAVALACRDDDRLCAALDLPGPRRPSLIAPHAFHVIAGFVLAALLVVCGFMFGPPADEGQIEPISSGSLAAYLFGATMIVLASFHADLAMIAFALLVAGTLFVAWRAEARDRRGRRGGRPRLLRVRRMGGPRQSGHAGAARRTAAGHRRRPRQTVRSRCI